MTGKQVSIIRKVNDMYIYTVRTICVNNCSQLYTIFYFSNLFDHIGPPAATLYSFKVVWTVDIYILAESTIQIYKYNISFG
jgi:hypothetical protein